MANDYNRATWSYDAVGQGHTPEDVFNVFRNFLIGSGWEQASWNASEPTLSGDGNVPYWSYLLRGDRGTDDYWHYQGDGLLQHCGIVIYYEQSEHRLVIRAFLENGTTDGQQILSHWTNATCFVDLDDTAPNNYLFIGGRELFYYEAGRDGVPNNLAQGSVGTIKAAADFNGTKDNERKWTTQGLAMDLFGQLRFANNRSYRCVDVVNGNANITTSLLPYSLRGTSSLDTPSLSDNRRLYLVNEEMKRNMRRVTGSVGEMQLWFGSFYTHYSPVGGRFRISRMFVEQINVDEPLYNNSSSTSNTLSASTTYGESHDSRNSLRELPRLVGCDRTLLPWTNVSDTETSKVYRIVQIEDNGRSHNMGVEWPTNEITVIP